MVRHNLHVYSWTVNKPVIVPTLTHCNKAKSVVSDGFGQTSWHHGIISVWQSITGHFTWMLTGYKQNLLKGGQNTNNNEMVELQSDELNNINLKLINIDKSDKHCCSRCSHMIVLWWPDLMTMLWSMLGLVARSQVSLVTHNLSTLFFTCRYQYHSTVGNQNLKT